MELVELAYLLHDFIIKSDEYTKLKEKESFILNDPLLSDYFNKYKSLQEEFIHDDSKMKELSDYKAFLYSLEPIKEYNKAYKNYMIFLTEITNICFKDLIENKDII